MRSLRGLSDDRLAEHCRQSSLESAWDRIGERYGSDLLAGLFVAWFGWTHRPIPWCGYLALVGLYVLSALLAHVELHLVPACVRALPYARELERRIGLESFPRELRKASRRFDGDDPSDWIVLVHSRGWRWSTRRLMLYESPPRGRTEHHSDRIFGVLRDGDPSPLNDLVREMHELEAAECRSKLKILGSLDLSRVKDTAARACDDTSFRLAVLRRDPPFTAQARFSPLEVLFDPASRAHPTYRVAALVMELPEGLAIR